MMHAMHKNMRVNGVADFSEVFCGAQMKDTMLASINFLYL